MARHLRSMVGCTTALCASLATAQVELTVLPSLADGGRLLAVDASADGSVIAGVVLYPDPSSPGDRTLFRWSESQGTTLAVLPDGASFAQVTDISESGGVVSAFFYRQGSALIDSLMWHGDGTVEIVSPPIGAEQLYLSDICADGSQAVGTVFFDGDLGLNTTRSVKWHMSGTIEDLGSPDGDDAFFMTHASEDGETLVGFGRTFAETATLPYLWTADAGYEPLVVPEVQFSRSETFAMSGDGSTVVGQYTDNSPYIGGLFRWTEASGAVQLVPTDTLDGYEFTYPIKAETNRTGTAIVGWYRSFPNDRAFIWNPVHGTRDLAELLRDRFNLDLADMGWDLDFWGAVDMSADGRLIFGYGILDGEYATWILNLPAGFFGCSVADITADGTCAPGFGEGAVTLSDFSCFLAEWALGARVADITVTGFCDIGSGGDGVDLSDFSCYLSEWSAGCP